jgi:hypothetical protein
VALKPAKTPLAAGLSGATGNSAGMLTVAGLLNRSASVSQINLHSSPD